jgi:hypothetical protein
LLPGDAILAYVVCGPYSINQKGMTSNDLEEGNTIMATLLSPSQNKPNPMDEEPETTQIVPRLTEAESTIATNKKNCWVSIARPLAELRELLAGPSMTEQERNRQTLTEARVRNAAALHGFYRTPF